MRWRLLNVLALATQRSIRRGFRHEISSRRIVVGVAVILTLGFPACTPRFHVAKTVPKYFWDHQKYTFVGSQKFSVGDILVVVDNRCYRSGSAALDTVGPDGFSLPDVEYLVWKRGMKLPEVTFDYEPQKAGGTQPAEQHGDVITVVTQGVKVNWPPRANLPDRITATVSFDGKRTTVHPKYFRDYVTLGRPISALGNSFYVVTDVIVGHVRIKVAQQKGPQLQAFKDWPLTGVWQSIADGEFQTKDTVTAVVLSRAKLKKRQTHLRISAKARKLPI